MGEFKRKMVVAGLKGTKDQNLQYGKRYKSLSQKPTKSTQHHQEKLPSELSYQDKNVRRRMKMNRGFEKHRIERMIGMQTNCRLDNTDRDTRPPHNKGADADAGITVWNEHRALSWSGKHIQLDIPKPSKNLRPQIVVT